MKVGDYNNIIAGQQTSRRRLLQGAAGLGAAAVGGFGAFSSRFSWSPRTTFTTCVSAA